MFASMFKSLFNKSDKKTVRKNKNSDVEIQRFRADIDKLLDDVIELGDEVEEAHPLKGGSLSASTNYLADDIEFLSIDDPHLKFIGDSESFDFADTQSEVGSTGENKSESVEGSNKKSIIDKINSLQCFFTWNIRPTHKNRVISFIQNRYGEYNLDISSSEFTFERYIGNLIISYEMFHQGEIEEAQLKILEIGKWLEDLDNSADEFYLSMQTGLKHVMTATFIHMLFATNLNEECKWLLDDIVSFKNMDSKSKATVHTIHAAVLIEYGRRNANYLKRASKFASKACEIDPNTPYWFYIYSLSLTAERHFIHSYKSCPTENEINAIQQAIMLSDGRNTSYNYHRMTLDRDITIHSFHNTVNKRDKCAIDKNIQENKKVVQMIKTIMDMKPKNPLIIVQCARTLMTLPSTVRDFKLGKKYLKNAVEMAPNDSVVLDAVKKAINIYNEMSVKNKHIATTQSQPPLKNKMSIYKEELELIVKKYKNGGKDPVPYLTDLAAKYNGFIKNLIMAEICSYTILFTDNLRSSVEQFITLIEQPEVANSSLIKSHLSSFSSNRFNLAELFCNEIRLATNSSGTSSEDILFYLKTLAKIVEICKLDVKNIDSSMKAKLSTYSSVKSTYSSKTHTNDTNLSDNEESVDATQKTRTKGRKSKHLQNTGPKVYSQKSGLNKAEKTKDQSKNSAPKNNNASTNVKSKTHQTIGNDQLKFKMSKFFNSSMDNPIQKPNSSNNSHLSMENLRNLKTQAEIENYTKQLYQNILTNTQQQQLTQNLHTSQDFNRFFHQNYTSFSPSFQQSQFQNSHPPPLLSLRPQISEQNLNFTKPPPKKGPPKKK